MAKNSGGAIPGPGASGMKGSIAYQAGTIVSKTLIDRGEAGTLTLFSFDKGQGLSEHTAPFDAFVYVIDGKAEVRIAGEANMVGEGEFIIMPANKPHSLKAVKKFKMLLVLIKK